MNASGSAAEPPLWPVNLFGLDGASLLHAWTAAVLVSSLKAIGLAQVTGIARMLSGHFPTKEDAELLRATYGPPPQNDAPTPFVIQRLQSIHRNELENIVPFFALSFCYMLTMPPLAEARALLLTFTIARFCHTFFYLCGWSPWRSIAWGVACQALLIMGGRTAAWLLPSAAIGVQIVVNAPMAMQWLISLGVLGVVSEQRRRFEQVAQRDHEVGQAMLAPPDRLREQNYAERGRNRDRRGGGSRGGSAGRGGRDPRAELEARQDDDESDEDDDD